MLHKKTIIIISIFFILLTLLIFLISLFFSSNNNNLIILQLQSSSSINDISSLFFNNLRTTITVSDKKQEVDFFLLSQDSTFFITQQNIFFDNNDNSKINKYSNNFYNYEFSSTINILSNRTQMFFAKYKFARKANDNFALCSKDNCDRNSINISHFNFMLVEDPVDKISGGIGLGPQEFSYNDRVNLFNELYKEKYIKIPIWYIEYNKNEEKRLIIGKYPYEISKKYTENDYVFFERDRKASFWEMTMAKIVIGNNNDENEDFLIKDRTFQFQQDFSLINGPPDYYNKIKNFFFNKYLSNQCSENTFTYQLTDYLYVSCNEDITLEDFPPIIIMINNNLQFELTYEELFMKSNGKILFLFISNKVEKYFNGKWHIGEPFLKKYIPVYNQKEYTIGFYGITKKKKKSYKVFGISGFIFLFLSIVIVFYLCSYIFKKYRNRKIRKAAREMKIEEISSKLILNNNENK
jgi:hypothetical protein